MARPRRAAITALLLALASTAGRVQTAPPAVLDAALYQQAQQRQAAINAQLTPAPAAANLAIAPETLPQPADDAACFAIRTLHLQIANPESWLNTRAIARAALAKEQLHAQPAGTDRYTLQTAAGRPPPASAQHKSKTSSSAKAASPSPNKTSASKPSP